jgi:hypothetical protein
MKRTLLAVFVALLSWVAVATVLNLLVRRGIAGYAAAEPAFAFTLGMQIARLIVGAAASLAAGAVAARIAPHDSRAPWIAGVILLVVFLPGHVQVWHRFPLWYHLTFLVSLIPLVLLGARGLHARGAAGPPARPAAT